MPFRPTSTSCDGTVYISTTSPLLTPYYSLPTPSTLLFILFSFGASRFLLNLYTVLNSDYDAMQQYCLLNQINSPQDLRKLSLNELSALAAELRNFMVSELCANPGHIGSSLGTVELTLALHYVYDTPFDKIIWDVGHQAYAHKIITGRRNQFHTNRKLNGISGFPKMDESPYDAFGAGHASVSISAALGMAQANKLLDLHRNVVAVIGDGALTGGLAYEGLNNAGTSNADMLVILNDNNMSISPNVGALKDYLLSITTSKRYNNLKNNIWNATSSFPNIRRALQNFGNVIKQSILKQSNLFESLNFRYFGPVDGHDIKTLVRVLGDIRRIPGPKLLHVVTKKGKGFDAAENNPSIWHAPGKFDPDTGQLIKNNSDMSADRYQDVFGHVLLQLARIDNRVVGVTPAMLTGSSMDILQKQLPNRCFDVGIAEGHAVTFSAGLAAGGFIPFCNIYSSFMQRAYDNVIHDVALQRLPVVFCLDRAGIVGEDGPTHHGAFDLAFMRNIPNMIVSAPADEAELKNLMFTALHSAAPFSIRYPRGKGPGTDWSGNFEKLDIGRANVVKHGSDIAVISVGAVLNDVVRAADSALNEDNISVEIINLRFVKPLDTQLLADLAARFKTIITVEDGVIDGGAGSAIIEFLTHNGFNTRVVRLGIPDNFVQHGSIQQLKHLCGFDDTAILDTIRLLAKK